jgi:pimeloyl-ACP methyl ester carboxylesterase
MRCKLLAFVPLFLALLLVFGYRPPAVVAQSSPQPLQWAPCPDIPGDMQCAFIQVPVDYANPDGPTFNLRIGRLPSTDPAHKRGSVIHIPGGPSPGIQGTIADSVPDSQLRQYFDVVSFDPRGIEQSNALGCDPALVPPIFPAGDRPPTRDEFDAITKANRAFFQSCIRLTGDLFTHLSVDQTASDIERIRIAIGQTDGLVAYGGSLGSLYGTAYLERYGDHVKTLVIDGVVDQSVGWAKFIARNDISVQESFDRFVRWCGREVSCVLHGRDVYAAYDAAVAAQPRARTPVQQFLAAGSDPDFGWPAIARLLADTSAGDTRTLDKLAAGYSLASTSEDPQVQAGRKGLIQAVYCGTFGPLNDYDALMNVYADVVRQTPRFAWKFWVANPVEFVSGGTAMCAGWPNAAAVPAHELQITPHPNVLVATATYDPPTPLVNAMSVWLRIPEAKLLVADGDGHQSFLVSTCAYEHIRDFFIDPTSAQPQDLCPLSPPDGGGPAAIIDQI